MCNISDHRWLRLCGSRVNIYWFITRPVVNIAVRKNGCLTSHIYIYIYITFHVFAPQLSGWVIALWRHQQWIVMSSSEHRQSWRDTESMCEYGLLIILYRSIISCKNYNNVCTVVTIYPFLYITIHGWWRHSAITQPDNCGANTWKVI